MEAGFGADVGAGEKSGVGMGMDFPGERKLGKFGREEVDGGVGGVASGGLKKRKGTVKRTALDRRRQDGVDDGFRLGHRSDECGGAELSGRA